MFNFYITGDGATDITDTAVTTMLAAETHTLFAYWNAIIKSSAVTNPWDFIRVWLQENLSGNGFLNHYRTVIKTAQDILYGTMEMVTRNLPNVNTRTY